MYEISAVLLMIALKSAAIWREIMFDHLQ